MDHTELLLAAAVYDFAEKLRVATRIIAFNGSDLTGPASSAAIDAWDLQHPVTEFMQPAYAQLKEIALFIRAIAA